MSRDVLDAFCRTVERFAAEHLDARSFDREHALPVSVREGLADLGAFGLSIPERFGGFELGMRGCCAVVSTLARHDRAAATTVGLHVGLGSRPLVAFGSEALRQEHLPGMASGQTIAAFATTEPEAGSDLMAIRTTAQAAGDRLRIDGEKIYVTNGGFADVITITASTPGMGGVRRGRSLVLLRGSDAGITRGAEEEKLGLRGSSTRSVFLEDVEVPATRLIGEPGQGGRYLDVVLASGRTVMASGCNGTARAALEATLSHTRTRRQWGKPLFDLDVVREQLARMAARLYAMEALVERVCEADEARDAARVQALSLAAKVFCSDGDWAICDEAVQLHGGAGFIEDTGVPLMLRDARITRIFEGANDVLKVRAGQLEAAAPAERSALSGSEDCMGPLGYAADRVAHRVATRRAELLKAHGLKLIRQPRLLHGLGHLAMLREATDATVRRAHLDGSEAAMARARLWLVVADQAVDRWRADPPALEAIDAVTQTMTDGVA